MNKTYLERGEKPMYSNNPSSFSNQSILGSNEFGGGGGTSYPSTGGGISSSSTGLPPSSVGPTSAINQQLLFGGQQPANYYNSQPYLEHQKILMGQPTTEALASNVGTGTATGSGMGTGTNYPAMNPIGEVEILVEKVFFSNFPDTMTTSQK